MVRAKSLENVSKNTASTLPDLYNKVMSEHIEMSGECGENCLDDVWCAVIGRCKRLGAYALKEADILLEGATYPEGPQPLEAFVPPSDQDWLRRL